MIRESKQICPVCKSDKIDMGTRFDQFKRLTSFLICPDCGLSQTTYYIWPSSILYEKLDNE